MKNRIFTGAGVAIITPFTDNNEVDYPSLEKLIEFQIVNGIDAIITCGTTGEASTLSDEEHKNIIKFTIDKVAKRVPVIAGTGSNDTNYCIELSLYAQKAGADGLLIVTPYYNKTSPKGLIKHFTMVADSVNIPIILYNVPSRTGLNISPAVYKELSKHKNIVATKEASGNITQIAQIAALCGDDLDIYSGNDDQIVPILSLGGIGVISVLANIMPKESSLICKNYFDGKVKESAKLQLNLLELIDNLFIEVNPIPVKAATALMGFGNGLLRMPLCDISTENSEKLKKSMKKAGLI